MERTWVESEVRRRAHTDEYDPRDYPLVFGAPIGPAARRLIEQRLEHSGSREDPTDDLLAGAPEHVARWLVERAALADGLSPGVPLTDPLDPVEHVRAQRARDPEWTTRPSRTSARAWDLMEAGLVRSLCNSTYLEMSHASGLSPSALSARCRRHALALERDPAYAAEAARITREILWRTYHAHAEALSPR